MSLVLTVCKRFNGENLLVSPDHIRDAAHPELIKKFSGFYQSILFDLASTELVTLEFQFIFDRELDGFAAHFQIRNNPVHADAIIVGDPLFDDTTNPENVDTT